MVDTDVDCDKDELFFLVFGEICLMGSLLRRENHAVTDAFVVFEEDWGKICVE